MRRRPAVIAYDVRCDKRRRRLARRLRAWRLDGQYSLCKCLLDEAEARELFVELGELIDPEEDALLLAWLDPRRSSRALTSNARIGFQVPSLYLG